MHLQWIRRNKWRVLATCTERGGCPLLEFLAGLEGNLAKDRRRMLKLLERISHQGPPRNTEISRSLTPAIWELRQGRLRVLWFYDLDRLIVVSHGFVKKSQKTPAKQIRQAERSRQQYLWARKRGELDIERAQAYGGRTGINSPDGQCSGRRRKK